MKFVVSSAELLSHLQAISKVINNKNTLPILDNFLFKVEGSTLEITASDLETTMVTRVSLISSSDDGAIAIPAKFMTEYLGKFSDQPLTFEISTENFSILINSAAGKSNIIGYDWEDFPLLPDLKQDRVSTLLVSAELALHGIGKTIFATGEDELRPVMNGIFIELSTENITFVASDSHKLVRYRRSDVQANNDGCFILPKKPAGLLRTILAKEQGNVEISFDDKNAMFKLHEYTMVSRLVEGVYPNYSSVIPTNNTNRLVIDRVEFLGSLRRVSMFTSQSTNLIKMELRENQLAIFAQDIDFSIAGDETLPCQYDGDSMNIGFKANNLIDILANLSSTDICIEISDPTRACLVLPVQIDIEGEDVLMLIMPLIVND